MRAHMGALVGSYNDWGLSASSSIALEKHAAAAAEHQRTRLKKWDLRLHMRMAGNDRTTCPAATASVHTCEQMSQFTS